jgi:hypothetical protein
MCCILIGHWLQMMHWKDLNKIILKFSLNRTYRNKRRAQQFKYIYIEKGWRIKKSEIEFQNKAEILFK